MAFLEIIKSAEVSGRRYEITKDETTIGRAADNDIPTEDVAASSHHCIIRREGKQFTICDLDSTNGTLMNDVPVKQARMNAMDTVTVGSVELQLSGDDIESDPGRVLQPASPGKGSNTVVLDRPIAGRTPAAFGAKRSTKGLWIAIGILVGIGLAALLYWFLSKLYGW